jgi:hypothetical protein
MLPDFLRSSYLQYKADTNAIASWLATTAKRCGYAPDLLDQVNNKGQQPSSQRLKGKARKQAREAAKQPTASSQPTAAPKRPTYTIAVKDFIILAQHIASYAKPPVSVPGEFVAVLNRAISVRQEHAAGLPPDLERPGQKEASDASHSFFVGVLESVRDILRVRMPSDVVFEFVGKPPGSAAAADAAEKLSNKFDHLELYEPSEEWLATQDIPSQPKPQPEPRYEADRPQDDEEAYFAFQLLLEDLNNFRNFIRRTWVKYQQGALDLIAASISTNTAIDLARRMEDELQTLCARHGGTEKMLHMLYSMHCIHKGTLPTIKERPTDDLNFNMYNVADSLFLPPLMVIRSFTDMVSSRNIPHYKPGYYGTYDPSSDRSKMSAREKFLEDKVVLSAVLSDFCYMCMGTESVPAEDELIRGLRETFKSKKIPIWLAFAAQVFLDIHHVLREDVDRAFGELFTTGRAAHGAISRSLEFHSTLRVETWPRSNDEALKGVLAMIQNWVMNDPIQEVKNRFGRPIGEEFSLMRQHPIFCGLLQYHLKVMQHEIGITLAGAWGSIMYTGHLYNAVRREKLLNKGWTDMDLIMAMQGQESFFVGARPDTPEDYLKRFALSMGYSASAFAKNKRRGRLEASKKGPRGLSCLAPVYFMFKERYGEVPGRIELTLQDVEKILDASGWEEDTEDNGEDMLVLTKKKSAKKRWDARRELSATQLLEHLQNALMGEKLEISFDYLTMHYWCWKLLGDVDRNCKEQLIKMYGPEYLEKENQLPFVVGYIFMAATETKNLGDLLCKKKTDVVTSKLMLTAAATIDAMIDFDVDGFRMGSLISQVLQIQSGIGIEIEGSA